MKAFFVLILFLCAFNCTAQEDLPKPGESVSPERLKEIVSKANAIMKQPDFYSKLQQEINFPKVDYQRLGAQKIIYDSAPKQIIKHIRTAEGQAFHPLKDHLLLNKDKILKMARSMRKTSSEVKQQAAKIPGQEKALQQKLLEQTPIKLCEKSETKLLVTPEGSGKEEIMSDMLFLPADFKVPDEKETYGKNVSVFSYDTNNDKKGIYWTAKSFGTDCLPSRYIMTSHAFYKYSGLDAVKNYSAGPTKGKLHKYAEKFKDKFVQ